MQVRARLLLKAPPTPSLPQDHTPGGSPWRDRHLLFLLLPFIPALMVFFQIEGTLPLWVVRDLGLGSGFFGILFTVNTLLIVVLEVPLNLAMGHWRHGRLGCAPADHAGVGSHGKPRAGRSLFLCLGPVCPFDEPGAAV